MFEQIFANVAKETPLVHCITNYVTVNDCANILLACGGSPIMADDEREAEEIAALCRGLVINIGTLNPRTIPAMYKAGQKANQLCHPVILDPVGAGASTLRTQTALGLIQQVQFSIIRGNASEIHALAEGTGSTQGVDASRADATTEENLPQAAAFAKSFAKKTGAVIAITGAIDLVADGDTAFAIRNGHPMMSRITGCGCMLSAMMGAYAAANPSQPLLAAAAATCVMGLAGQIAAQQPQAVGNASMRTALIDAVCRMDIQTLIGGAKIETR